MVRADDFNRDVPLPAGLTIAAIRKTIEYVERELADLVDIYFQQANVFSAIVGIFAIKGLEANSVYERHRDADVAQQRFPDLKTGVGVPEIFLTVDEVAIDPDRDLLFVGEGFTFTQGDVRRHRGRILGNGPPDIRQYQAERQ